MIAGVFRRPLSASFQRATGDSATDTLTDHPGVKSH